MSYSSTKLRNASEVTINPATEDKQDDIIAELQDIDASTTPYAGTASDGTVALASANTWYAVPSGTPPAVPYLLIVSLENTAGTIRFSFDNGGTPSATNGNAAPDQLSIDMPANGVLYYGSSAAGDDVNWCTKNKS